HIGEFLVLDPLQRFERKLVRAMRRPGALQLRIAMAAHPQREPDPVLDLVEIGRLPDPDLAGRAAADREHPGCARALLVVGYGLFAVIGLHGGSCRFKRANLYPGIIDKAIMPG